MATNLKIALAQLNPLVGDVIGNVDKLISVRSSLDDSTDILVAPELYISGYPIDDLVLREDFLDLVDKGLENLAKATKDCKSSIIVGAPRKETNTIKNSVFVIENGEISTFRDKYELPNSGVFDEQRIFTPGNLSGPVNIKGVRIGIPICEDIWTPEVVECITETGGEIILVPNGSPFEAGKTDMRVHHAVARVVESKRPLVYLNQIGGQDELVFDGASFIMNADRTISWQLPAWQENLAITHWKRRGDGWICEQGNTCNLETGLEATYQAMTLGLRDYVNKNGFPGVILGMSGGIDSALSAAVAVDALGSDRVHCVMMPSPYTSEESLEDAAAAANMLGVKIDTVPIGPAMDAYDEMLLDHFKGSETGITEENIQSRSRGLTLMALSNKLGAMVLSTGNKSEMSVGYATLYGDMCGGYSVLKDVYKMTVFELSKWRNKLRPNGALGPEGAVMPERIISKPPSAELKPDQKDEDTLPPYEELDAILHGLIEDEANVQEIASRGFDIDVVMRIWQMLDRAEYKRRQAPPGVKIGHRAFGRDRRYPITNSYKASYQINNN